MTGRNFGLSTLILASVFVCFSAHAVKEEKPKAFVLCKNNRNVRTIRIDPAKNANCKITYTKSGKDETVGESRSFRGCQSVMDNIRANLEDSRWNCRKVRTANVTYGSKLVR